MSELLTGRAAAAPTAPALIDGVSGVIVTWAELEDLALRLAARLAAQGVRAGDRVAVVMPAGPRFAAALHACLALGAVLVPLSPRDPPRLRLRVLEAAEAVVLLGVGSRPVRLAPRQRPPERATAGDPDIALVQTSGTTGAPKLVRLTAGVCTASARACLDALGRVGAAERWLLPLSPHRVGGLAVFWRSAVSGCAVVHLPRFEERSVTAALGRGPTLASMVPVMLHRLLDAGAGAELARLRAILVGGAPSSREEVAVWLDHGLRVCPSYGLTETGSQIAVVPPGRVRELAGSAGLVHPGVVVDIAPARDGDGEILVGGPLLTPGYTEQRWNDAAFTGAGAERRLHTGDLGRLREGVLTVAGRRDRLIVTGGEKVRPEDVEAVLLAHPQVRDAGVWGTPDPRYGSIVHAVVSADADAATLEAWCRRRLAPHQVPRRFSLVAAVPRSADGKLAVRPPEL